jgi:hypothetical protein
MAGHQRTADTPAGGGRADTDTPAGGGQAGAISVTVIRGRPLCTAGSEEAN